MAEPWAFGVITHLERDPAATFARVRSLGLTCCQLAVWGEVELTEALAQEVRRAQEATGVSVSTLWVGWPGPAVWDFQEGPVTLGIVPPAWRAVRLEFLRRGSDFAARLGVGSITTHAGFLPENPTDPLYPEVVAALRYIARHCQRHGQGFRFETGQETPVTLLRVIQDVGTGNLGINLDTANLILYGKGNPVDALDVFGRYVQDVHIKDGEWPTDGHRLGRERPVGEGRVDFEAVLTKLHALGYQGPLTIEREIAGEEQVRDILRAIEHLRPIVARLRGT
jgi:L-ribulose-5-phosphate 3-epimerase